MRSLLNEFFLSAPSFFLKNFCFVALVIESSVQIYFVYFHLQEGWGLQKIDVRDNGCGIDAGNAAYMGQPHYTSKISCHNDLEKLTTYGFRGEALASLCAVSNVTITTKTESSAVATCYTLDQSGSVSATKPAASATGTAVTVTDLFKNLPVRKRFSSNPKKCKEEFKRVEELLMAYGLIHPALRIVLRHNKMMVWQKSRVSDHRTALLSVFGTGLMSQMEEARFPGGASGEVDVLAFLPKLHSDPNVTSRAVNDRCFIFINDRPVVLKQAAQVRNRVEVIFQVLALTKSTAMLTNYQLKITQMSTPQLWEPQYYFSALFNVSDTLHAVHRAIDLAPRIGTLFRE